MNAPDTPDGFRTVPYGYDLDQNKKFWEFLKSFDQNFSISEKINFPITENFNKQIGDTFTFCHLQQQF